MALFDAQTAIGDAFTQVLEIAAVLDVLIEFAYPRFDGLITCATGDFDDLDDGKFLTHEGRRVESVEERLIRLAILGGQTRRSFHYQPAAYRRHGRGQPAASGQFNRHKGYLPQFMVSPPFSQLHRSVYPSLPAIPSEIALEVWRSQR